MNKYKDYFIRPRKIISQKSENDYHKDISPIRNDRDIRQLQYLFFDCFNHHVNTCLKAPNSELKLLNDDPDRLISKDNLTAYFMKNYYVYPTIYITKNSDDKSKTTFDEFVNIVSANPITNKKNLSSHNLGSNRISYLIGEVGEGKSALVTKLINTILDKKTDK